MRWLHAYRAAGAELPFGDLASARASGLEGYYWRIVEPAAGRVVVALCGACRGPAGPWALVALAAAPGGHVRSALTAPAIPAGSGFAVAAGRPARAAHAGGATAVHASDAAAHAGNAAPHASDAPAAHAGNAALLEGGATSLRAAIADASLAVELDAPVRWPRRAFGALGAAHALPGLPHYWQPVVLAARVRGHAEIGGERLDLDGATAYAEKTWGTGFPAHWWWGHVTLPGDAVTVAFAGGRINLAGTAVAPTAVILRRGDDVVRLAPPLARTRISTANASWRLRTTAPGLTVELEGEGGGDPPHALDVPISGPPRVERRSRQHLTARLRLVIRRRGRIVYRGESGLAGLELGRPLTPGVPAAPPR